MLSISDIARAGNEGLSFERRSPSWWSVFEASRAFINERGIPFCPGNGNQNIEKRATVLKVVAISDLLLNSPGQPEKDEAQIIIDGLRTDFGPENTDRAFANRVNKVIKAFEVFFFINLTSISKVF